MVTSRRSFFARLAGLLAAARVAQSAPVYGWSGGAVPGALVGGLDWASGPDRTVVARVTREQVAVWFDVPPELIARSATFRAPDTRTDDHDICCDRDGWWLESWVTGERVPLTVHDASARLATGYTRGR